MEEHAEEQRERRIRVPESEVTFWDRVQLLEQAIVKVRETGGVRRGKAALGLIRGKGVRIASLRVQGSKGRRNRCASSPQQHDERYAVVSNANNWGKGVEISGLRVADSKPKLHVHTRRKNRKGPGGKHKR